MSTDPIFGNATHADPNSILCVTRDGAEHRLPGPGNMDGGLRHRARMRFAFCYRPRDFTVTFRLARSFSGDATYYVEESSVAVERGDE